MEGSLRIDKDSAIEFRKSNDNSIASQIFQDVEDSLDNKGYWGYDDILYLRTYY